MGMPIPVSLSVNIFVSIDITSLFHRASMLTEMQDVILVKIFQMFQFFV